MIATTKRNYLIILAGALVVAMGIMALTLNNNRIKSNNSIETEVTNIESQSKSDEVGDIEKDLMDTDLNDVDKELQNMEMELDSVQ